MNTYLTIYRGTHQIGGCVTEIQMGDRRIVIDFGANLPGSRLIGTMSDEEIIQKVFPSDDSRAKCEAVLFTHYHGDHYALYKSIPSEIPKYIGYTAKKLLEIITKRVDYVNRGKEKPGLPIIQQMKPYQIGSWKEFAPGLEVKPLVVDHSALDAYMFLIRAGRNKILYTGDFRNHGISSETGSFEQMIKTNVGEVDILITEGTMLSRIDEAKKNPVQTEADLGRSATEIFRKNHENVVLVSSTNLDSIMEFYHAVPKDKAFVCDAYQARVILTAIEDKHKYYKKYSLDRIGNVTRNFYIIGYMDGLGKAQHCYEAKWDILKEKGFVMLARVNHDPDKEKGQFETILDTLDNPKIIYSMWEGYREGEFADPAIIKFLEGNEDNTESLHTSGHAYVETIASLIEMTNPKTIIPMHTECADQFARIDAFAPYANRVRVLNDGEKYEIES